MRTRLKALATRLRGGQERRAATGESREGAARSLSRSNAVLVLPGLIVVFVAVGIGWSSVSADDARKSLSKQELSKFLADDQLRNDRAFCAAVAGKRSSLCPDLPESQPGAPQFSVTGACLLALDDYEKWFGRTILADGWQDFPRWREAARQVREQCGPDPRRTWGARVVRRLSP
jgi:hypothetical protein